MSFWGATVITSLVTAVPFIGEDVAYWVWGGFSINNATLTRFFSLHYLLPFIITGIICLHLTLLHTNGSTEPLTLGQSPNKTPFHPYYTNKDAFIFAVVLIIFTLLASYAPNLLGHSDNFLPANPLVTPAHIVPEWYFTPFYAILRACPNKLGGAIGMFSAILLLFSLPYYVGVRNPSGSIGLASVSDEHKTVFWAFSGIFWLLMFLGSRAAAEPYVLSSKLCTFLYFSYFIVSIPAIAEIYQTLVAKTKFVTSVQL
jgi:quinol-cytochrome oxidoreductase complex cytochrome b subunit